EVIEAYGRADIFVLPSKIAGDGDRDGLPNVLMEAATQGLPLLATHVSAIPEFVHDGKTGRLTPPGDAAALSEALLEMIQKPEWRLALGRAGEARVREIFDFGEGCDQVAALLGVPSPTQAVA
ncbi:MAG: glycosyltransferase, partial [Alphaproteobacteria bacterium]